MKKNDEFILPVTDLTDLGSGFGRAPDGSAVFVPGTVPGDRVLCHLIKVNKQYAVGKLLRVETPSPYRTAPECPVFGSCGGCSLCHITPDYEREMKKRFVEAALRKEGLTVSVRDVRSTGRRDRYRNKVQLPLSPDGKIGFFAPHSHRVIELPDGDCRLQHPAFTPVIRTLGEWVKESGISCYDEKTGKGLLRHLCLRTNADGSELLLILVLNGRALPRKAERALLDALSVHPAVCSVWLSENTENTNVILGEHFTHLSGAPYITDALLGRSFAISPRSFYQVNHDGCELLYATAIEKAAPFLRGGKKLVDLFCGIGTVGICMAADIGDCELLGVEIIPEAVENARENAVRNGLGDRAAFLCGDANDPALDGADVVVVDPPRAGLEPRLITRLAALRPEAILYISCSPATLARDLRLFAGHGYTADSVQPVDMFPCTGHVETVVLMSKV